MSKRDKYKHPANPERAQAMHGLARSNAAGTHADKRTKRRRSRADAKRHAIREE